MDQNIKLKYQKYKYIVKKWEKSFKEKQGRIPSKYDIKEAPKEIRDSYKMYYNLKTSFLEDTLGDILSEDGFDLIENSQGEFSFGSAENDSLPLTNNDAQISSSLKFSNILINANNCNVSENLIESRPQKIVNTKGQESHNKTSKEFEAVTQLDINERAWNDNAAKMKNNKQNLQKTENKITSKLKSTLSTKLFSSTSFSKRNPRKSLSRTQSNKSITSSQEFCLPLSQSQEQLPDLEAILLAKSQDKSKDVSLIKSSSGILDTNSKILNRKIDNGWLNRQHSNSIDNSNNIQITTTFISSANQLLEKSESFGISNLSIQNKCLTKTDEQFKDEKNITKNSQTTNCDYDSDSVISNSEDESTTRISQIRHIRKKRRVIETENKNIQNLNEIEKITVNEINLKSVKASEECKINENTIENNKDKNEINLISKIPEVEKDTRKSQRNRKTKVSSYNEITSTEPNDEEINSDLEFSNNVKSTKTRKLNSRKTVQKQQKPKKNSKRLQEKSKMKNEVKINSDIEQINEPANDLEYNLDIDDGVLNLKPRINPEEISQAEHFVQKYLSNSISQSSSDKTNPTTSSLAIEMKKKKLEEKILSGKLNENYVRIDIKKKIYTRGKRNVNYSRFKKKMWKQKKAAAALSGPNMDMGGCDGGVIKCFTCGQPGHFTRNCKIKGDTLLPIDAVGMNDDDSLFPTLKEAEDMAASQAQVVHSKNIDKMPEATNELIYKNDEDNNSNDQDKIIVQSKEEKVYIGHQIPEDFLEKCGFSDKNSDKIQPLYSLNSDGSLQSIPSEVYEALHMFGHKEFRKGQDKAIMRILSGLSTLVTLSTGSGKSLCYQLPAYLYSRKKNCITLVVSPLVSLMEDQVHGVPLFLRANCLHTNQTSEQKQKVLERINKGECDILLVSPEAIVSGEKSSSGFGSILRKLPSIAFACIDEAHCVSQWSHNFRPSYLMICKVLREKLKINTILGLTATATFSTKQSIIKHLKIHDGENGVISDIPVPNNLILSISKDLNRDAALIELLRSERFSSCQSIIIYCTRRDECERIAAFIRTCFQDKGPDRNKRKRVNWQAEAYHAGMPSSRRRTIQNAFMRNELRIIVATIAFGMGINKPDIRAIIHYNMPKAFENYVQECGRAGRDGDIAHCHLFLDSKGLDQNELKRHIYANSFDRYVIRKLLQKIFIPCSCNKNFQKGVSLETTEIKQIDNDSNEIQNISNKKKCPGHEIGFSIEETVEELDVPGENISTLLCYLELDGRWDVQVLSNAYIMCKVISYGGPKYLKQAAKECPPLAMAIALQIKNNKFDQNANIIEFPIIEISSAIGWNSGIAKYQLKNLEWTTVNGLPKRSSISVSFYNLGFRIKAPGNLTDDELDEALDALYNRSIQQEKTELIQLQCVYNGLSSVAFNSFISCSDKNFPIDRSNDLKKIITDYFQNDYPKDIELTKTIDTTSDDEIINDVISMINMYPENKFTGRTLARIFHGIQSPNYPAVMWSRCKYWRAHSKSDFNRISKIANSVIVKFKM